MLIQRHVRARQDSNLQPDRYERSRSAVPANERRVEWSGNPLSIPLLLLFLFLLFPGAERAYDNEAADDDD